MRASAKGVVPRQAESTVAVKMLKGAADTSFLYTRIIDSVILS